MDSVLILNTNINVTNVEEVANLLQKKDGKSVAVCNTNTLVRCYKDNELQNKINAFDVRVPDGFPVAKASSILYKNHQKRVDGYNIFHKTIEKGLENNTSHYFFGNEEFVTKKMIQKIKKSFPDVNVVGYKCPPVKSANDLASDEYLSQVKDLDPDIIWVSLGFPKQEIFMNILKNMKICRSNLVGIGAVFEWVAGTKYKAPEIVANIGLEWVFRLLQEPKRLYKRYFVDNILFIIYFIKQYITRK